MPPDDELARFQAALLELLGQELPPDVIQKRLCEDAAFAAFREYVRGFKPRMLDVAVELVNKSEASGCTHLGRLNASLEQAIAGVLLEIGTSTKKRD